MNINISNNELNLINFTGKIVVNEDDNTVSFLDVILREPEEVKSISEYCKAISLQACEIKSLKEEIQELKKENEDIKSKDYWLDGSYKILSEENKKFSKEIQELQQYKREVVKDCTECFYGKDEKIEELERELQELKLENEQLLKYKETIDEVIEKQKEEDYLEETNDIADVSLPFCNTTVEELKLNKIITEIEKENPILDDCDEKPLKVEEINRLQNMVNEFKSQKSEKKTRVRVPLAEKNKNIKEGIIKFFQSRGGKSTFKYNFGQGSKPESVEEAKEIWKLCKSIDTEAIRMAFKSLVFSGKIQHKGGGRRNSVYILMEAVKPVCPRCSGSSLVKNENKYSTNEDYYHDKDGYYFTCLSCGEEVAVEEREAA